MPQLILDDDQVEILLVVIGEYASTDDLMRYKAEVIQKQLRQCLDDGDAIKRLMDAAQLKQHLDDRDTIKRLTDALQELYDFAEVDDERHKELSEAAFRKAGNVLRELREHHE